ncbi:MAG: type II toxin-antitoxin system YhaV family toxin [Gammaproteobacteria bacterium]|nr:type II toxin-antitoxin system YhaV family toxin [Gammaproteobacteria bacterium]
MCAPVSWLSGSLGPRCRHWRPAKTGRRARLCFHDRAGAKLIVCAQVNDQYTLCSSGSRADPCAVLAGVLAQGSPPDDRPHG